MDILNLLGFLVGEHNIQIRLGMFYQDFTEDAKVKEICLKHSRYLISGYKKSQELESIKYTLESIVMCCETD